MYRLGGGCEELAELVASLPIDGAADRRARGATRRVLRQLLAELVNGDERLALAALLRLGRVETLLGEYDAARKHYARSLTIATTLNDPTNEANSLLGLADIARRQGDYGDARASYDRALTLATTISNRTNETHSLLGLADVARRQGDHDVARELYDQALTIATTLDEPNNGLVGLGRVAAARGERARAWLSLRRAATIYRQLGQREDERNVMALLEELDDSASGS
jgi:tetratricopeptide (TPR) repeat protein